MIEPLPNCFSIWPTAISMALRRSRSFSGGIRCLLHVVGGQRFGRLTRLGILGSCRGESQAKICKAWPIIVLIGGILRDKWTFAPHPGPLQFLPPLDAVELAVSARQRLARASGGGPPPPRLRRAPPKLREGEAPRALRSACGPSATRSRRARASGGGAPRALRSACGPSAARSRRARASGGGAPRAWKRLRPERGAQSPRESERGGAPRHW